jgi:hypothetical protein
VKDEKSLNQQPLILKRSWSAVIFGVITVLFPLLYVVIYELFGLPVYFSLSYGGVDPTIIGLTILGLLVGVVTILLGVRLETKIFLRKIFIGGCILVVLCWISYPIFNSIHNSSTPEVEIILPDNFQGKFAILIANKTERSGATWGKKVRYVIPENGILKLEEGFGFYTSKLRTLRFKSGQPIILPWDKPSTTKGPHGSCFFALYTIYQEQEFEAGFLCEVSDKRLPWAPHPTRVSVEKWVTDPPSLSE